MLKVSKPKQSKEFQFFTSSYIYSFKNIFEYHAEKRIFFSPLPSEFWVTTKQSQEIIVRDKKTEVWSFMREGSNMKILFQRKCIVLFLDLR